MKTVCSGLIHDVARLLIPAACLVVVMVGLGFLVTDVLPPTAVGKWDAEVPRRLVEFRQQEGFSESKLITSMSATSTIVALTALVAVIFRLAFGRWRESLLVVYAVSAKRASSLPPHFSSIAHGPRYRNSTRHRRLRHSRQATPPQRSVSMARSLRSPSGTAGTGG